MTSHFEPIPKEFVYPSVATVAVAFLGAVAAPLLGPFLCFLSLCIVCFVYGWAQYRSRKRSEWLDARLALRWNTTSSDERR